MVNIPLVSPALITHCNHKSTIHYSYLGCHQVMDCCRKGCPLNKSTNKNANVNIFSHKLFHLKQGMKNSPYIDSQQREQLKTYTMNGKDDSVVIVFFDCRQNDRGQFQGFYKNKGKMYSCPPALNHTIIFCKPFVNLKHTWNLG